MAIYPLPAARDLLEKLPRGSVLALGLAAVAALCALDQVAGLEGTLLIFSAVPVVVGAMYAGLSPGLTLAAAAGGIWLLTDRWAFPNTPWSHLLVEFAARTGAFALLAYLEVVRENALRRERDRAHTDELTGAENGRAFRQKAGEEIARMRRHGKPLTVAYLDLDDFKASNDLYGHTAGDGLLAAVAGVLRAGTRVTDTVARMGGDEFAVLLPETSRPDAETTLVRVREDLEHIVRKGRWPTGFSIGVVTFTAPPSTVDELLHAADQVMYEAKAAGKGKTLFAP